MVSSHLSGLHPRSEELVEVTRREDRGKASPSEVARQQSADEAALLETQTAAGISDLWSGGLDWQDILRPLALGSQGIQIGSVTRFFDTNSFYRQPTVTGEIRSNGVAKRPELRVPEIGAAKQGKPGAQRRKGAASGPRALAILPGPYTFSRLALDHHYRSFAERIAAVARVVAAAAEHSVRKGAAHVLLVEPSIVVTPPTRDQWPQVKDAIAKVTRGLGVETTLHTQFGDLAPVAAQALDLPVDSLSADFFSTEIDALRPVKWTKGLVVGAIDGRNSLPEEPEDVAAFARRAREALEPKSLAIAPSSALEYLPRNVADLKVNVLGKAAALLGGG
jgi:5-methyltetrahydropteroyltriglutamate--homocysteine methyltransferase